MAQIAPREVKSPFERRIARAAEISRRNPSELLDFYCMLAGIQNLVFKEVNSSDPHDLLRWFPHVVGVADLFAPMLSAFARDNLAGDAARQEILAQRWEGDAEALDPRANFFAHALLEPFAMRLASRGNVDPNWMGSVCPFCSSRPGAAVLRGEGDGAKRFLICSLCGTEWTFRRILCACCGEEDKEKLPVYLAEQFDYVRVEACDTCKSYLKAIDLTKNGLADAVVDEIASVPLNIWAEEHGYTKLAPNVMGM